MSFVGGCHCGAVQFQIDDDIPTKAMSCNCSICRQKGLLLAFFPIAQFKLEKGQGASTNYEFNKHKIQHCFCSRCGSEPFAAGNNPDGSEMRAINLRCVENVNLEALEIQHYDGASK